MKDKEKIQLKGRLEPSIVQSFKELVLAKHGKLGDGMLSYEMETALNQYISGYRQTHTHKNQNQQGIRQKESIGEIVAKKQNPYPKVYDVKEKIKEYLSATQYEILPQCISKTDLVEALQEVKGYDSRTTTKWLNLLIECQCIKEIGPKQYEFS